MGFSRRLAAGFAAPSIGLAACLMALGWLCRFDGFVADKLVLALAAAGSIWRLWARMRRTNLLIARFVEALAHGDLTQGFRSPDRGAGLDAIGTAFDAALARLRSERHAGAAQNHFAQALVDEAPTPLLAIDGAGRVHLANKAARRLFREADGRPAPAFAAYGTAFAQALAEANAGDRRVCRVAWNGLAQRAVLAVTQADRGGESWRIVSLQIIQRELDSAEMATQTDLVRVLTHEIMNALTPVTSLAQSAARLLASVDAEDAQGLADACEAVAALARRADALSDFVTAYRDFSRFPRVTIAPFATRPWLDDLLRAFAATPHAQGVDLQCHLSDAVPRLEGDANLLGQVLLNLLRNAAQAVHGRADPQVRVSIETNAAGRQLLSVSDNGPGIPDALREEIFLPFFTTKSDGNGVGLSFARQIVLLHGGAIGVGSPVCGGATIQIVL